MLNTESRNTELHDRTELHDGQVQSSQVTYYPALAARHRTPRRPGVLHVSNADESQSSAIDTVIEGDVGIPSVFPLGNFREVQWPDANLNGSDVHGADFSAAVLTKLCALGANLSDVQMEEAQLQGAALCGADLTSANLRHADLRNANLSWCDLQGAGLFAADLRGANLAWADLRNVDLREANLSGAYYNYQTQWPAGFEPARIQMIYIAETR